MTDVATGAPGSGSTPSTGVVAAALPLAVVGAAFALWLISDRLLYVGPLDRATFGWSVVVPIWAAAPLVAGFAWRRLAPRARSIAATLSGLAVGSVAAGLFWLAVASPACQFGPVREAGEWWLPAIALGFVIGGGFALSCLVASHDVQSGHPLRALLLGAVGQLAVVAAATIVAFSLSMGGVCQRPPA